MSMTWEAAIEWFESHMPTKIMPVAKAAYEMAIAALRGPTREMAERMRGDWIEDEFAISHCPLCGYEQEEPELITPFCPACGAPMTDEAVDMMLERWKEAANDNSRISSDAETGRRLS